MPQTYTLNWTEDQILAEIFRRTIDGKRSLVYPAHDYDNRNSNFTEGEDMYLRDEHAKPFIDAGLLSKTTSGSIYYFLTQAGIRRAIPLVPEYKPMDIEALIRWALDRALFGPDDAIEGQTAIPAIYVPGTSPVALVLGDNAAGKSLFRRVLHQATHKGKKGGGWGEQEIPRGSFPVGEFMGLSMQSRTSGGVVSCFVYGTEDWQSTGENSANSIMGALKSAATREHTTMLVFDEPDLGMSAGASAGVGVVIRDFIKAQHPLVQGMFLTTHSPALVQQLLPHLDPHYIFLGDSDGPKTLNDWLVQQANPVPVLPDEITQRSHTRYRLIQRVLDDIKKKN